MPSYVLKRFGGSWPVVGDRGDVVCVQYVETTRSKVVLGSEIDDDDLRRFSDDPIITGPLVCHGVL